MAIIVETIVNGTKSTPTATPTPNAAVVADGTGHVASGWGGVANSLATLGGSTKVPSGQLTGVLASTDLTNDAALEKTANKNAASGYAGLSAGSKITLSQVSAVLASTDLTNDAALEKTANKNAASGYAGLSAGSKITLSQISAVLASSDLTNDAALEKTANKGAASGYASLDAGSLVVQNPTNATATPTASKIPLADGAGHLAAGWGGAASTLASLDASATLAVAQIPAIVGQWFKFTKLFSDFSFAGNTNDITLLTLPSKGVINKVIIHHTVAFSGGTVSAYTVSVGISGTPAKYAVAFDVFQAPGNTTFGFNAIQNMESFGATTAIVAEAISTGDTLDNATAGSVDIYVNYSTLP